jgi:N-acetylglucosamine-6-phosphate deacetylase
VSTVLLAAARVAAPDRILEPGWIRLRGGRIDAVSAGLPPPGESVVDLGRRMIAPGFIDLHVHGGHGAQVNSAHAEETALAVRRMAAFHTRHGTTALVATTVSDTPERTLAAVRGVAAATGAHPGVATVLGSHLEGPWISPHRAGAQDPRALRDPDPAELARLLEAAGGTIRMITIAPELPGAFPAIAAMIAAGVQASVGHTDADHDTVARAFDDGVRHVTHLFNAMPPMAHRAPGPAGAALSRPGISVELIADGHHVHPAMLAIAAQAVSTPVLVTDSTPAAGLAAGRHLLGAVPVVVHDGLVTLAGDGHTIAGSTLTMERAVATLVGSGVSLPAALRAASTAPADVLGLPGKGRLAAGADADLVVLEPDLTVALTVIAGRPAHDPAGLLAALPDGAGVTAG